MATGTPKTQLPPDELIEVKPKAVPGAAEGGFDLNAFWQQNQRIVLIVVGVVVLVAGGIWYYFNDKKEKELEAQVEIINAFAFYEKDSFNLALKGTSQSPGLLTIAEDFSGTPTGNQARYLAGMAYLQLNKPDEAIEQLKEFPRDNTFLSALALAGLAAAHEAKDELDKAADLYEAAAGVNPNNNTTPYWLKEAARCYELADEKPTALKLYRKIKRDYPRSEEGRNADKYIYRLMPAESGE